MMNNGYDLLSEKKPLEIVHLHFKLYFVMVTGAMCIIIQMTQINLNPGRNNSSLM